MGATNRRRALLLLLAAAACQRGAGTTPAPAGSPGASLPAATPEHPQVSSRPCVDFRSLRGFLPAAVRGYTAHADEGSIGKYGEISVSSAERLYLGPRGAQLSVRIVDTTLLSQLAPPIQAAAKEATRLGSDAALKLEGGVGFVRYEPDSQRAEANLLVGERFVVAVVSTGVPGPWEVRQVSQSLDLAGLSKLR